MAKAFCFFLLLIVINFNSFAQSNINDYKYIIVPNQFEFLTEKNQYDLNLLTKFLFNKHGYKAYMQEDDLPEELIRNRCLGLVVNVVKDGGFLKTKLRIDLKDCNRNVVQSSRTGESREKEYNKAYNLALRDAFTTFQNMNYAYNPKDEIDSKTASSTTDTTLNATIHGNEEINTLKVGTVGAIELGTSKEVNKNQVNQVTDTPSPSTETIVIEVIKNASGMLYAQPIENGFQIVDTTPKKVMILRNSGVNDVFKVEGTKAIVYKKGDAWMYSESGDIFEGEVINIKF